MQTELKSVGLDNERLRATVLVVEDDPLQLEFLVENLRDQGYETVGSATPSEVVALTRSRRPQIIVLDICFPDGCGLQLCSHLADDPETCEIPVIVLSGSTDNDVVRKARAAGCRYFLKKPYDPNTLLLVVEQALRDEY
jgi:CheY-like chemotaxis protein